MCEREDAVNCAPVLFEGIHSVSPSMFLFPPFPLFQTIIFLSLGNHRNSFSGYKAVSFFSLPVISVPASKLCNLSAETLSPFSSFES